MGSGGEQAAGAGGEGEGDVAVDASESDDLESFQCQSGNARIPKRLNQPIRPSAEAVAEHEITHLPYRSWCPICVKAKGREDPHRRGANKPDKDDADPVPTVSFDYNTLEGKDGAEGEDEDPRTRKVKVIVGKDETTGMVMQHRVHQKGSGDKWLVKRMCRDLEDMGRRDVVLKTDGEPAIVSLQSAVQAERPGRTIPRNPPAYNPQSNGACEKAVQDCTDQARVLKMALEARIGQEVPTDSPLMEWILQHAAFVINRFSVGKDGMTPWERLLGSKWRRPMVEFGEKVHAKLVAKVRTKGKNMRQKKKLAPRSVESTWVGQMGRTGEHVVIGPSGNAVRCRTIRRVPAEDRWDAETVLQITATPRRPAPSSRKPEDVTTGMVDGEGSRERKRLKQMPRQAPSSEDTGVGVPEPRVNTREEDVRELRITEKLLEKFGGYTAGCPGCEWKISGRPGHRGHSAACRTRVYTAMEATEDGRAMLRESAQRMKRDKREAQPTAEIEEEQDGPPGVDAKGGQGRREAVTVDADDAVEAEDTGQITPRFGDDDDIPELDEITAEGKDVGMSDVGMSDSASDGGGDNPGGNPDVDDEPNLFARTDDSGDDDENKVEPNAKRQRLKSVKPYVAKPNKMINTTGSEGNVAAALLCANTEPEPPANTKLRNGATGVRPEKNNEHLKEELQEVTRRCLKQLSEVKKLGSIQEILKQIDKGYVAPVNRRQRRTAERKMRGMDVAEAYSPPRITEMAGRMGMNPGFAIDLTQDDDDGEPWDLSKKHKQDKAKKKVEKEEPYMLIPPPCVDRSHSCRT